MNALETIQLAGFTGKIFQDEMAESPDIWGNEDTFIVYDHRQFTVKRKGFDPETIFEALQNKRKTFDGYWFFPVYAYIHSGVALSLGKNSYPFTCNWDTSFRGFALVKRQKGWTYTSNKAYKVAESLIEEWNQYLSGDVYGYQIEGPDGNDLDSCWGFYGFEYIKDEVRSLLAHHVRKAFEKRIETVKTLIRSRVPLHVRQSKLNP